MRPEDQIGGGDRYTVVPRTLVFLTRGDQVLLLKGAPDKRLWAGKYNGIGGHLEPDESPHASALRELREETGFTVGELTLRGIVHVTLPQPPGVMLFVFVGEAPEGCLATSEEGTPEWVDRDRIPTLPLVEDLPALLPRVLAAETVVFAHYTFDGGQLEMAFD
jgi:8-oxo-dGTP diphosphatase